MCFSAQASFAAAGVLSIAGFLSLKKAQPHQHLLAALPALFAVQQCAEGVVWLTLGDPLSLIHRAAIYTFLFFAYVLWPSYMWQAILSLEIDVQRRKLLQFVGAIGAGISAFLLFNLMQSGASVAVIGHHLVYHVDVLFEAWADYFIVLYALAVLTPFFISTKKYVWIVGAAIFAAMVVSYVSYYMAFVSVWCFFTAIISGLVWWILDK